MTLDLSTLEQGQPCFVELYGGTYPGMVSRQFDAEQVIQVKTPAARFLHMAWQHMSFRWSDGRAVLTPKDGRLIVPTDGDEQLEWESKVKRTAAGFGQLGLGI